MSEYPQRFTHKGQDHMSFKGYFVSAATYYFHSHNNMSAEEIFLTHGTEFKKTLEKQDKGIEQWHKSFPEIRNMQEHFEYILKHHIPFEDAVKLRAKMEGKTDKEKIKMLPPAYSWVLSIHLLQEKRRGLVKPVEKAVARKFEFEDEGDGLDIL